MGDVAASCAATFEGLKASLPEVAVPEALMEQLRNVNLF
jgi:hypothetical protein